MNHKRKALSIALSMICCTAAPIAQAYTSNLPKGSLLPFTDGVTACVANDCPNLGTDVISGSYFTMDKSQIGTIQAGEKTPLVLGPDGGLIIGVIQTASGSHTGAPNGSENAHIDAPWSFFGNTGMHYNTKAVTTVGANTAGNALLDFSGWTVHWNGLSIPMGQIGTQATVVCKDGSSTNVACANGTTYRLTYNATVPANCGCGFENVPYGLILVGTVVNDKPTVSGPTNVSGTNSAVAAWTPSVSDANTTTGVANTALTCEIVTQPPAGEGTASVAADCSTGSYDPTADSFAGTTSFTYRVFDGADYSTARTVTVNSSALPVPVANNDEATTNQDSAVVIDVFANDTDTDGAGGKPVASTVVAVDPPANGTADDSAGDGTITYTPDAGFVGTDSFTYTVADADTQTSSPATVTVTVNATSPASGSGTFSAGPNDTDGTADGRISSAAADSGVDPQCVGGCFDFEVSGLVAGNSVNVVLPLDEAIPAEAVYRKYMGTAWVTFTDDGNNDIKSAPGTGVDGTPASCPPPGASSYSTGLTEGDRCVQLTIQDDGPNDADATDGTILDPGGVGVPAAFVDTRTSGTSGCSMTSQVVNPLDRGDWWILAGFLAWLGVVRRKLG